MQETFSIWSADRTPSHAGVLVMTLNNTLNVCRRTVPHFGGYKPSPQSAECICRGLGFHSLQTVSNLKSKPGFEFAERYSGVVGGVEVRCGEMGCGKVGCGENFSVSWNVSSHCTRSYYYTYLACSCNATHFTTPGGCRRTNHTSPTLHSTPVTNTNPGYCRDSNHSNHLSNHPSNEPASPSCTDHVTNVTTGCSQSLTRLRDSAKDHNCDRAITKPNEPQENHNETTTVYHDLMEKITERIDDKSSDVRNSDIVGSSKLRQGSEVADGCEERVVSNSDRKEKSSAHGNYETRAEIGSDNTTLLPGSGCDDKIDHQTLILYLVPSVGGLCFVMVVAWILYCLVTRKRNAMRNSAGSVDMMNLGNVGSTTGKSLGSLVEISEKPGFERVSTCDDSWEM